MTLALQCYRGLTWACSPLLPAYLRRRARRGKEDASRVRERLGYASQGRPGGTLVWVHAASVGEANSALPLISALRRRWPELSLLLTTGTVTSAGLMRQRLPEGAIHQYVPVDTPQATKRFIDHWQPDVGLFVESELWPGLLAEARRYGCRMALLNARMSEKSFRIWNKFPAPARELLGGFSAVYAQSEPDAERFRKLGAAGVEFLGNMKYDGEPLPFSADALLLLEAAAKSRPRWLAASIHPGEDAVVASTHRALKVEFPHLLTVVAPRHPERAAMMRDTFVQHGCVVAQRSAGETIAPNTDIYLADTMGELGVLYRLCPLVFVGGSLIEHGGQNPLEPARLGNTILFGPYMFNFTDIARGLLAAEAARQVEDAAALVAALSSLLHNAKHRTTIAARASAYVIGLCGVNERLLERLAPWIEGRRHVA